MPEQAIVLSPAEERARWAEAYPDQKPPVNDEGHIVIGATQPKGKFSEKELRQLQELMAAENRLRMQGVRPCTILNMNCYPLRVNGVLVNDIIVPPKPKGKLFSIVVIKEHRVSWKIGDENMENMPILWVPILLGNCFKEEYFNNGGVVVYEGNGLREDPLARASRDEALKAEIESADQRMLAYAKEKKREGNNLAADAKNGGLRNINDIHRGCAEILHDRTGEEYPNWMDKTPGQGGLGFACPRCKAIPNSGAYMCPNCTYILNPAEAYRQGELDVEDSSLKRCTREELEELGISGLIEETIAERNERNKQAAEAKKAAAAAKPAGGGGGGAGGRGGTQPAKPAGNKGAKPADADEKKSDAKPPENATT